MYSFDIVKFEVKWIKLKKMDFCPETRFCQKIEKLKCALRRQKMKLDGLVWTNSVFLSISISPCNLKEIGEKLKKNNFLEGKQTVVYDMPSYNVSL